MNPLLPIFFYVIVYQKFFTTTDFLKVTNFSDTKLHNFLTQIENIPAQFHNFIKNFTIYKTLAVM